MKEAFFKNNPVLIGEEEKMSQGIIETWEWIFVISTTLAGAIFLLIIHATSVYEKELEDSLSDLKWWQLIKITKVITKYIDWPSIIGAIIFLLTTLTVGIAFFYEN